MTITGASATGDWVDAVDASCSLPTAEKPLRLAEFDALFTGETTTVDRDSPTAARFGLRFDPSVAGRAAELSARETQCCSFFTFNVTVAADLLQLQVSVPAAHAGVLDALVDRARAAAGRAPR